MRRLICLIIVGLCFPLAVGMAAEHEHWEEVYFQANQAYKEGRFQEAIDGYRQLIQSGHGSGHLYYNLGNGYIRLHQLGKAILNYERARLLLPRDADLDFNLRYARDHIRDKVPEVRNTMSIIFFWLRSLTLGDLFWGFAVLNTLFWGILCLRIFYRSEWTYYLILTLLTVWLITGLSLGLKWHQLALDDRAVIVPEEVNVLAGPDVNDTVLFKLHEGTLVHCERSEDGWVLVRFQDGKRGWVQADGIENIRI